MADLSQHVIILNNWDSDTRNATFTLDIKDPIILNIPDSCTTPSDVTEYIKWYCSNLLDTEAEEDAAAAALAALNNSIGRAL
jgi:hypothetical protein